MSQLTNHYPSPPPQSQMKATAITVTTGGPAVLGPPR